MMFEHVHVFECYELLLSQIAVHKNEIASLAVSVSSIDNQRDCNNIHVCIYIHTTHIEHVYRKERRERKKTKEREQNNVKS